VFLILVFVSAVSLACRTTDHEERRQLKGTVLSVDKRGSTVTISHEEIPGYMDAMTMPFKLKDPSLLDVMSAGDRVQATLVVSGMRTWLEDVIVVRDSTDTSISSAESSLEPKPGDQVPDFTLVNQDGKRVSLHRYRGRAVAITFIYTRCPLPDYCPLMTDNFSAIQKSLKAIPALYAKTHFLSISVDPEYDTPKVLREYAIAHDADTAHWEFATGSKDQVKQVATYFGMQYWQDGDQVVHSLRTAIIAPDGKLAKLYRGSDWKPTELATELRNVAISEEAGSNADRNHGVGVVQSIDREHAVVQIDHEEIKDLMPPMNMPYAATEKSELDALAPGDKVDFWLESTPSGYVIVKIQKR